MYEHQYLLWLSYFFFIQASTPPVSLTTASATDSATSGTPGYIWVIVVFVILLAVIAIVAVVALVLLSFNRKVTDKLSPK